IAARMADTEKLLCPVSVAQGKPYSRSRHKYKDHDQCQDRLIFHATMRCQSICWMAWGPVTIASETVSRHPMRQAPGAPRLHRPGRKRQQEPNPETARRDLRDDPMACAPLEPVQAARVRSIWRAEPGMAK